MAYENKDAALADAVRFLINIKRRGEAIRLAPALAGGPTLESRALFGIEADAEEFLNDLAADHPDWAGGWKMTPDYAADRNLAVSLDEARCFAAAEAESL